MQHSNAAAVALGWTIQHDVELRALRGELAELEAELKTAEMRIPENVRDLETLELHMKGETTGDLREMYPQFFQAYASLRVYAALLRRKWALETAISDRKAALGVPLPN